MSQDEDRDTSRHDPDWWIKKLVEREREHVTGVLPPAQVRREVEDFNARVMKARYTPVECPPLITMPRDVDETVAAWRERRTARVVAQRAELARRPSEQPRRRGFRRS